MKQIKLFLVAALAVVSLAAQAQIDFSNPAYAKWGETPKDRETNMFNSTYMREAVDNKNYNEAARLFQLLIANCPKASEAIYARGVVLYKNKINRATSLADKKAMVDSLMIVHDLRIEHFGDHATRGKAYVLDSKARDYYNYMKSDPTGIREAFKAAIDAAGENADPALVLLYFQAVCDGYKSDDVMADEVMAEYERLAPKFETLEGEDAKMRDQFMALFSVSGVATCENLEAIFKGKLEADPNNEEILAKAVKLMDRMQCKTPFYIATVEKYYEIAPTSQAAMALAGIFQGKGEYDKASKYLRDALEAESDVEEQEALNARIALIELAANRLSAAAAAARASINAEDDTKEDNGIAYFVLAQTYAASAGQCSGFEGQAAYWAAYDMMAKAVNTLTEEEASYKEIAQKMLNTYPSYFPSKEDCFFNELNEGSSYTVKCGIASGTSTTVRMRK